MYIPFRNTAIMLSMLGQRIIYFLKRWRYCVYNKEQFLMPAKININEEYINTLKRFLRKT